MRVIDNIKIDYDLPKGKRNMECTIKCRNQEEKDKLFLYFEQGDVLLLDYMLEDFEDSLEIKAIGHYKSFSRKIDFIYAIRQEVRTINNLRYEQ